ncbi:MAG: PilZ domain-containing protein [Thermodesulfobacteriota bacterium]|nr:PilZ domain-containing protein [Thermodesulfobacteriota bacterium]
MSDEKRRFTRVPFKVEAEMSANNTLYRSEEIDNLSIGGCLLPIAADLDPGTECRVGILLSGSSSELNVRIEGEVVRQVPGAVAIKFTRISPDSLFHLQNIIRYNSPDPDAVEKEIHEHPGLI